MLHHAARKGAVEALKRILELNSSLIYLGDIGSNTALHYSAMNGNTILIKITSSVLNTYCILMLTMIGFEALKIRGEN